MLESGEMKLRHIALGSVEGRSIQGHISNRFSTTKKMCPARLDSAALGDGPVQVILAQPNPRCVTRSGDYFHQQSDNQPTRERRVTETNSFQDDILHVALPFPFLNNPTMLHGLTGQLAENNMASTSPTSSSAPRPARLTNDIAIAD